MKVEWLNSNIHVVILFCYLNYCSFHLLTGRSGKVLQFLNISFFTFFLEQRKEKEEKEKKEKKED